MQPQGQPYAYSSYALPQSALQIATNPQSFSSSHVTGQQYQAGPYLNLCHLPVYPPGAIHAVTGPVYLSTLITVYPIHNSKQSIFMIL